MGYRDYKNFFDRELSWLAFNQRVLEEALDPTTPLMERLKFIGIVATNLDEFFMIRVSGVQDQIDADVRTRTITGATPQEQFVQLHLEAHRQSEQLFRCYRDELIPAMREEGINITHPRDLSRKLLKELRAYFDREIFPVLTPLAVDSGHPFPRLRNLSLNLIVRLVGPKRRGYSEPFLGESLIAIVQVPAVLPRLVELPAGRDGIRFVLLEDLITEHIELLFPGYEVMETAPFRVTRDADIEFKEIDAEDLLTSIEAEIRERERGAAVRLQIDHRASSLLSEFLARELALNEHQIYRIHGPIAIAELSRVWSVEGREHLKDEPFSPNIRKHLRGPGSIFSKIRRSDILLHHPFESFVPVVDFIREAAEDPRVLAIKQTLYRTSGDSPIIKSLIKAAENGKQVAALVELKARFDEEKNIIWARQLEEAGVHVVYGLVGLKTHAMFALVVRKESNGIRRYVHLGTGNYNPSTARMYTDTGLLTCDPGFCDDASELFNLLTGYSQRPSWQRLVIAPDDLRPTTMALIAEEREKAESGKPARIRAKMNSLVDPEIIVELYKASRAGVQIDLCVRGVCCLRPGVEDLSENIRVWSIVDRFLEHSRIFIFGADPNPRVFMSSADWMERNMDRRIEVMFPILDPALVRRCVEEIFAFCARDNVKARHLQSDGKYRKLKPRANEPLYRSQVDFLLLEEEQRRRGDYPFNAEEAGARSGEIQGPPPPHEKRGRKGKKVARAAKAAQADPVPPPAADVSPSESPNGSAVPAEPVVSGGVA